MTREQTDEQNYCRLSLGWKSPFPSTFTTPAPSPPSSMHWEADLCRLCQWAPHLLASCWVLSTGDIDMKWEGGRSEVGYFFSRPSLQSHHARPQLLSSSSPFTYSLSLWMPETDPSSCPFWPKTVTAPLCYKSYGITISYVSFSIPCSHLCK